MHVYPHPDLPLVPRRLLAALQGQALQVTTQGETRLETLADVDACAALSSAEKKSAAEAISAMVQKVCYGRVRNKVWSGSQIDLPDACRLSDLKLTDRALVSLQRHEFFAHLGTWRKATIDEIIGQRGDHRVGARLMLALLLAAEEFEARTAIETADGEDLSLEAEIESAVRAVIHSTRTASICIHLNGWGGRGTLGLKEIAVELGVTHERARQIAGTGAEAMKDARASETSMPRLRRALQVLLSTAPCLLDQATSVLRLKRLAFGEFSADAVLEAAKAFRIACPLEVAKSDGQAFIVRAGQGKHIGEVRHMTRRALRAHGILNLDDLRTECRQGIARTAVGMSMLEQSRLVEVALTTMPGWSFLDSDKQWATVTLGADGEDLIPRGPIARVARLAVYFNGVRLSDAMSMLESHEIDWPPEILLALCLRMGLTIRPLRDDWWIEARGEIGERVQSSMIATTEYAMTEMIRLAGGRLDRGDLLSRCETAGIHRSTVLACIKAASLFRTSDGGSELVAHRDANEASAA